MKIHSAAAHGDKDAVLRELEAGVPVDALDEKGQTPLMVAVANSQSNLDVVRLLLERGANPNFVGGEHVASVLIKAVIAENIASVECLLDAGADINLMTEDYGDALSVAVRGFRSHDSSWLSMMDLLLERGAVVQEDEDGESALSAAFDDGNFVALKRLVEAGVDESRLTLTPLTRALVIGTVDEVKALVEQGASLEDRDSWKRTPWLVSLAVGDVEKAKVLMEAGANINEVGWCDKTPLMYAIEASRLEMLKWLLEIELDVEASNEFGETALMEAARWGSVTCVRMLLESGADPERADNIGHKPIARTSSLEVVRLLLAVGQDLNDISSYTRAALLGIEDESPLNCSHEEFEGGRLPRFGTANPEKMDIPFWKAMVRSGAPAYVGRVIFVPEDEMYTESEMESPVWCYHRFGKSINELPDGRFIEIGGEHEDSYDRDFCIYNDVFVHHSQGQFAIYGYPREVFPPTDFHSATFFDGFIYIIGCLGYHEQRVVGYTPVYRLNVETLAIEKVETSGENPGWIYRHKAVLKDKEIYISGGDVWNGPASPEERERKAAERAKLVAFPVREDFASNSEWIEAMGQHLDENRIEEYERPERFVLNLKSLQWRRLVE